MTASLVVHLVVGALVLGLRADPPGLATETNPVILVELFAPPPPTPAPQPDPTPDPAPSQAVPSEALAVPAPPAAAPVKARPIPTRRPAPRPVPAQVPTVPVSGAPAPVPALTLVGGGALAGARTAGGGGNGQDVGGGQGDGAGQGPGGGRCDMLARLQAAVRDDPEVRAAIAEAHLGASAGSRAILVWDGDWLQSPGQMGKGLAGVRQAISVEVAFAPAACRSERVRGLALISLADGPGAPRLALGAGSWSWNDLVSRRR